MFHVGPPPAVFVPPTIPAAPVLLPAVPYEGFPDTASVIKDSSKPTKKPKRMSADVWAVFQELVEGGGTLDLTEEISSLAEMERQVRESSMTTYDKARLITRLADRRVMGKREQMRMLEKRRDFVDYETFGAFLEELSATLFKHVKDPGVIQAIAKDLGGVLQMMRRRTTGA